MANLQDKELKQLEKYCGYDYAQRYRGIIKKSSDKIVKVVNTGMVSSGKSSLFNILIDSTEEEHFPTGAARTTTLADYYDYNNISFIDTPGIDVRSEDDALAFHTIMEADIIMIVHNIRTGPLNRSEAEWIENIVSAMKDVNMCKARMIFVCTWKDTREKDEDYQHIIDDVKKMVFEIAGTEIPFFDVSVKKYLNGVTKGKQVLTESSGIPALRNYLDTYAVEYLEMKHEMNQEEMQMLMQDVSEILRKKKTAANTDIQNIQTRIKNNFHSRWNAWGQVFDGFSVRRKQLSELEQELNRV